MLRSFLLPGLLTALAICITPVTSALAEDAPREQVFIEHWIVTAFEGDFLGYMAAMKAGDSEKVEWWIKRFHHQAFYYWLASRGPDKWIQPLPRADRTIAGLMRIGQIRDGIAEDWDPGRLLRIERVDGQLLETDLRQQETWMPGEAWMPGIPLKSLEDPLKYRELVAQFRTQLLEITANKTGESGRGDGIAPVTPPTPPDMRVRIRRFLSDDGDRP